MIKISLTSKIINSITKIEENKFGFTRISIPDEKLRIFKEEIMKYNDEHYNPNYSKALEYLAKKRNANEEISNKWIYDLERILDDGNDSKEERTSLTSVNDLVTGKPIYIPPQESEVEELLVDLEKYIQETTDHPLVKASVYHYQLVTIHPLCKNNGIIARMISNYIVENSGYGFDNIVSWESLYESDKDNYYKALQMDLPIFYYSGRNNPPHFEKWIEYFLEMLVKYSAEALEIAQKSENTDVENTIAIFNQKEKDLLKLLITKRKYEFTPIEISKLANVTNKTIINRLAKLIENGYVVPIMVNERIRTYKISDYVKDNQNEIVKVINKSSKADK